VRAAYLVEPRRVSILDVPVPEPGPGEVLVRVRAVGICRSDVHYYLHGRIGDTVMREPLIMGHEFAGELAVLGTGVTGPQVGDKVAVDPAISCGHCEMCLGGHPNLCRHIRFMSTPPDQGALAEYVLASAERCFELPPEMTFAEGAMLEPLGVALHSMRLAKLLIGDTVAVVGCGPIGLLILQLAQASGALDLAASDKLDYRLECARSYGASLAVNVQREDTQAAVAAFTAKRGMDIVFEAAGGSDTLEQAIRLARAGGTVILAGIPESDRLVMTAGTARRKGLTIKLVRRMKHTYPRAIALAAAGKVDLVGLVTHRLPLARVGEAFELAAAERDGVIKAVIEM